MKRMALITVTLCLMMVATVEAGVVAAQAAPVVPKNVKQFDVGRSIKGRGRPSARSPST